MQADGHMPAEAALAVVSQPLHAHAVPHPARSCNPAVLSLAIQFTGGNPDIYTSSEPAHFPGGDESEGRGPLLCAAVQALRGSPHRLPPTQGHLEISPTPCSAATRSRQGLRKRVQVSHLHQHHVPAAHVASYG